MLNNRVTIDFDQDGNWTEIETEDHTAIPTVFLVQKVPLIYAYITEHYKDNYIIEIDRERKGYEVKLNNELELIFNKDQIFIGIDSDTADNDELISFAALPASAQSLLNVHFSSSEFVLIKKEVDAKETEYNVYTTDGFQLEFNQAGDWMTIESKQGKEIPTALFPATITTYIQQHYSDFKHTGIEKKRTGFEVELQKGKQEIELLFDQEGYLLGIEYD